MTISVKEIRDKALALSFNVHDQYKTKTVGELTEIVSQDRIKFDVILLNVTGDMNVATSIRTAHILGFKTVHVIGRRKFDNRPLVGSDQYMDVKKSLMMDPKDPTQVNIKLFEQYITDNNLFPILCEQGGINISEKKFDALLDIWRQAWATGKTPCIIMGNEGFGIQDSIIQMAKQKNWMIVSIPQKGVIRSLNVSAAFAIIAAKLVL